VLLVVLVLVMTVLAVLVLATVLVVDHVDAPFQKRVVATKPTADDPDGARTPPFPLTDGTPRGRPTGRGSAPDPRADRVPARRPRGPAS
jgi:hypothetical protein